jgi:NhaA family Na+:H+ antiporter
LNSFAKSALPAIAALGGMVVPALVYLYVANGDKVAVRGFGIPVATDIAFAVSVLSIFSTRVPASLKAFLMALAIFDDIGAILVIAIFYNHSVSILALSLALATAVLMYTLNRQGVRSLILYVFLTIALWALTLWSGVHATIAGVVAAFLFPAEVHWLQHRLHPWVIFLILPLFAFLNAGVSIVNLGLSDLVMPVSLGITLGLVIGKPMGVFLFTWVCVTLGLSPKPSLATWPQVFGVAIVCGVGFTMSLFVGMLAFEQSADYQTWVRSGVLLGSGVSALLGALVLNFTLRAR